MKKNSLLAFIVVVICCLPVKTLQAQAGWLDNTFSSDGKVLTQFGSNVTTASAVVIQSDGKIVVAGSSNNSSTGFANDFAVARYWPDGTLDNSFSGDGKLTLDLGSDYEKAFAVAVQSDDKILVGGVFDNGVQRDFALVRFNPNGTLDSTFNSTGIVKTDIGGGLDIIRSILVLQDESIIVAGTSASYFVVARYNSDGTLDHTFNGPGYVFADFGGAAVGMAAALQADGKILVAGRASIFIGGAYYFAVARYTPDGYLDNTFGNSGKTTTYIVGSKNSGANAIAMQPDGKIILAGYAEIGSTRDLTLARFKTDGSLDSSFGLYPGRINSGSASYDEEAFGVAIQSDGKIVASGGCSTFSGFAITAMRFLSKGTADSIYGSGGQLITNIADVNDQGSAMAIQQDNKVVVAGYGYDGNDNYDFAVVRFNPAKTSSIKETLFGNAALKVFPNPGNGIFNMTMAKYENASIEVYNAMGALVYKAVATETNTIDLSSYANGLYLVKVLDHENLIATQKLIKQ